MVENKKREKSINKLIDSRPPAQKVEISSTGQVAKINKQTEEHLRNIIEIFTDGIMTINMNGIITLCNKAFAEIIGLPKDEIIGKDFLQLPTLQTNNIEKYFEVFNSIVKEKIIEPFEFEWVHKDGALHSAEVSFTLLKDGERNSGIQVVARDITKYKIKYEQMKIANQHLYQAQKLESIGMLAGGIAHDFNNLLASILGNISLAKMIINPDDKVFNILTRAEKVSLQAKELIQQLMSFAKCNVPIKTPIRIAKIIKDATELALRGSKNNYELSTSELLLPVEVDESQLIQAFNNIIIHANKQMTKGGTIKIWAENVTLRKKDDLPLEEGVYVKIAVVDQGLVMLKEEISEIFEPFCVNKVVGLDLGLKIAYSIIKEYGGHMTIDSKIDAGTTYTIYLPACLKDISVNTDTKKEIEKFPLTQGKGKVLVMDDEIEVREMVGSILTHFGYEVNYASNGTELIKVYQKATGTGVPFDLVIMDLTIRGGLGAEATIKELVKINPKVKAVVTSGYSNDTIMTDFRRYGFSGVIAKPFSIEELIKKLYQVLNDKSCSSWIAGRNEGRDK